MIYSFGLFLYMLAASPFYLLRVLRGRYRSSFAERFGSNLSNVDGPTIWIHACSVGEAEAAAPFVEIVKRERTHATIIVSTVTETGHARAEKLYPGMPLRYLPFDFLFAVRRHLDTAGALEEFYIMETELWPNLIRELDARGVPVFIVNGRISDKAWPRYRRFAKLFTPILAKIAAVAARTELDEERFRHIGAAKVRTTGNIKFDRPAPAPPKDPPEGRFIIFGSTHPGEEELAVRVFTALRTRDGLEQLRMILAPRHIERAAEVARMTGGRLRTKGWDDSSILVLDTHGELAGMYAVCAAACIGGSFVPVGGHNPLEAGVHGVPVIWGPRHENFRDACAVLDGAGGFMARDEHELEELFAHLVTDEEFRKKCGEAAKERIMKNRGSAERAWKFFREVRR